MKTDQEVDIDDVYEIDAIRNITFDKEDRIVYLTANKYKETEGIYIVQFMEDSPFVNDTSVFLVKWNT